jgi:hypothetical protein
LPVASVVSPVVAGEDQARRVPRLRYNGKGNDQGFKVVTATQATPCTSLAPADEQRQLPGELPQHEVGLTRCFAAAELARLQDPAEAVTAGKTNHGLRRVSPVNVDKLVAGGLKDR